MQGNSKSIGRRIMKMYFIGSFRGGCSCYLLQELGITEMDGTAEKGSHRVCKTIPFRV